MPKDPAAQAAVLLFAVVDQLTVAGQEDPILLAAAKIAASLGDMLLARRRVEPIAQLELLPKVAR